MFKKEVYNLELYENVKTPLVILDLGKEVVGMSDDDGEMSLPIHYRIVGSNYGLFSVEEEGGQLYLTQSPDREQREKYILRVKASTNKSSKKVPLFFYTLYIEGEGSGAAGEGEAIVRVNILDINDNEPVFDNASSEITAAVPTTAEYGHPVTRLQAWDNDAGLNSQLHYSFVRREGDGSNRFEIDPVTGEVISTASFLGQAGASFELLVRATDRNGEGLSASKSVVVDVISPLQEASLLIDKSQAEVEASLTNLTLTISKMAGISVRKSNVRPTGHQTELRVYGVEGGGSVLDGGDLVARLTSLPLTQLGVQDVQLTHGEEEEALGSVEVAVLTMACLVFLGAFIAVLCICCIKMKRSQKHYPAPLAIPLPNYSYDGKELERQASQRFGTIPRVTKLHDRNDNHENHEKRPYAADSSEDDVYLGQNMHHSRPEPHSHHSTPNQRKSVRSTKGAKSSGESSRSRDSGIDDNRDCCSCRQSSVSSRDSYGWGGNTVRCTRCCGCAAKNSRRHRSSSPARRACSLKQRCSSHRSLPRHAHSHHDLRDDTETDSELSDGPLTRVGSAHSSRKALYTAELFSNSLTPAHSEAKLTAAEVRLASTTANRGHSWRGDHHPLQQKQHSYQHQQQHGDSHISLPSMQKQGDNQDNAPTTVRTSIRKSNLKTPSGGVRLVGLSHTARNNAMV